jgi:hypothetical protein
MINFVDSFPQIGKDIKSFKVHLATGLKDNNPLIAFLQGNFKEWQERQTKKNFERENILSFIAFDNEEWLYAGVYKRLGCTLVNDFYEYDTELLDINTELIGRLIIRFKKTFRQSYPYLENCIEGIGISQILKEKFSIVEFPGYERVIIDYNYLQTIIRKNDKSWRTALQNAKGIYLITDKSNGKHYVGSAYGEYALWSRWAQYSENGHGSNLELKKIIDVYGLNYAQNFQFSLLEVRLQKTDDSEIIEREQHWKKVLMARDYGYNKN